MMLTIQTDFGESKQFSQEELDDIQEKIKNGDFQNVDDGSFSRNMDEGRGTFVGTPLYVAPEML